MLTCFSNLADHIFSLYQCSLNSSLMCLNPYMTWQGESYGQIASQHWALARFAALQISTKALTASSSNWRSAESCSLCFWFIASPCNSKWIGTIQARPSATWCFLGFWSVSTPESGYWRPKFKSFPAILGLFLKGIEKRLLLGKSSTTRGPSVSMISGCFAFAF